MMQNLPRAMKLAHEILQESPSITYKKNQFHFCCGEEKFKANGLEEVQDYIMQRLYKHWLQQQFNSEKSVKIEITIPKKDKNPSKILLTQTRQKWSRGKAGDPRGSTNKNRKTKRFSKTQVLSWIRQKVNGRFSSEEITHSQYCQEFLHENKNAEQRRHWREKSGKKSSYSNKIIAVR
tara:strand:+ start:139 stop:672 length:534 start_codon:yes stop_codon:yes gene_type:complete